MIDRLKIIYSVNDASNDIETLKREIEKIEEFVKLAKEYPEDTVEQKALKYYAVIGKVKEVADKLNDEGYRIGNRKWISNDVTAIINKPSKDPFEVMVRECYKKRHGKAMKRWG